MAIRITPGGAMILIVVRHLIRPEYANDFRYERERSCPMTVAEARRLADTDHLNRAIVGTGSAL
jgi:hypothetical protein